MLLLAAVAVLAMAQTAMAGTPSRLPVYDVSGRGFTPTQASRFAAALNISSVRQGDGSLEFVDRVQFGAVPVRPAPAAQDEDDGELRQGQALDEPALRATVLPSDSELLGRARNALRAAGVASLGRPNIEHTELVLLNEAGDEELVKPIDTQVEFRQTLNGVPITGPGAKSDITFGPNGRVTRVDVAGLRLRQGPTVPLLPPSTADTMARNLVRQGCGTSAAFPNIRLRRKLVYYADETGNRLFPRYLYEPTVVSEGRSTPLEGFDLPAVRTGAPRATLRLSSSGSRIAARTAITGGTPPYTVRYSSCSGSLDSARARNRRSFGYDLRQAGGNRRETVFITVTDANGLSTTTRAATTADRVLPPSNGNAFAAVNGSRDYGVWSASAQFPNSGSEDPDDFLDEMDDEVFRRHTRYNGSFDETDWIEDSLSGPGSDNAYADNVDMAFVHTHGNPQAFNTGDVASGGGYKQLRYDEALWGDGDLEWIALQACEILAGKGHPNSGGLTRTQRWGQAMTRRAHMLLSYQTVSYSGAGSGNEFGDNLADDEMGVALAWFDQAESEQPDGVVYAIMGPMGPNGEWNYFDHAFGLGGGTTADVPSIQKFWLMRGTV